jgi:hypothetical protein
MPTFLKDIPTFLTVVVGLILAVAGLYVFSAIPWWWDRWIGQLPGFVKLIVIMYVCVLMASPLIIISQLGQLAPDEDE